MSAGETKPTQPLRWEQPEPARRRRRAWPWVVAFIIVAVLAVGAWFAAEAVARNIVENTVRTQIAERLSLPADHEIDVEVPGMVLPQLIGGSLNEITVSSQDVPVGTFEGDVTVTATDVPVRDASDIGSATATVTLDQAQLQSLLSSIDQFPAEGVTLADPDVAVQTQLQLFGVEFPVGVALTPSVADGDIVLTPASFDVAGAQIDAAQLAQRFGALADVVVRDWTVCIAEYIPAGVTLTDVHVDGDVLVADADVDGGIVSDTELQENGTCSS
jgi:uncharacterized protein YpmS